ncbi:MAG TPA: FGGY family carbohydrate kinase, partial [Anaerolineales bacterium]
MQYVIGCDIGSQSLKTILVSAEGKICGEASASYPIDYPQPAWAEQSPEAWMDALADAVRSLMAQGNVESQE